MNSFLKKMLEATRLTGRGQLAEATAAIQSAIAQQAPQREPARGGGSAEGVLDGLVREVEPALSTPPPALAADVGGIAASAPPADADAIRGHPPSDAIEIAEPVVPAPREASFSESTFTNASGTRMFKLYAPAGREGRPLPLVVMLHGCTQNPDDFAAGTQMNALAEEQGFFVLYPAQATRSNAHKCWNWFVPADQQRGLGEPALLAGMTRHVMQTHAIDAARIYVAGLSAGGAMAAILAREYPDLFAAAGIHSGLAAGAAHDVASAFAAMRSGAGAARERRTQADGAAGAIRPVAPLIVFHGDADHTVAARNADLVSQSALEAAARASAAPPPSVECTRVGGGNRAATRTVWRPVAGPSLAEQWTVHGAPHAWSGGSAAGTFTDPAGPDASREMLRFFFEHPLRTAASG